jgi:predicted nucleotidyltransferase
MVQTIDEVVLKPGDSISFANRDELLETLDRLDRRVPGRGKGRTKDHREHFCIVRYLQFLAGAEHLPLPVTLTKTPVGDDPPDFTLAWAGGRKETLELTDGSTREYQRALSLASDGDLTLPININTPDKVAAELWADILFAAFLDKARRLEHGRFHIDHLLIYDLTGLGLFVSLEAGAPLLRQRIEQWYEREHPVNRFTRVSVLRDQALLLDVTGAASLLSAESPFFRLGVIRARNEEDLRSRLRALDRYCRTHAIRHLKLFGSVLGDRSDGELEGTWWSEGEQPSADDAQMSEGTARVFRPDSDLDLLVEFEPGARVTLLDMARMERELSDLIGFKVDLRTAEDLSRYFRQEVLEQAVELDPAHAGRIG